jgi:hypothetical protein
MPSVHKLTWSTRSDDGGVQEVSETVDGGDGMNRRHQDSQSRDVWLPLCGEESSARARLSHGRCRGNPDTIGQQLFGIELVSAGPTVSPMMTNYSGRAGAPTSFSPDAKR